MATIQVSNSTQLESALKAAGQGSTIELAGGNYDLAMRGSSLANVVITSANANDPAVFNKINLNNVSHLTFNGVDFNGGGDGKPFVIASSSDITVRDVTISGTGGGGHGLWIAKTDDFTIENSVVKNLNIGLWIGEVTGLTVQNNTLSGISKDAMIVGKVHDALFAENNISMDVREGTKHTDAIQFWNTGPNDPMTNVTVRNNYIDTNNDASHGIYAANGNAKSMGGAAAFENITIKDNTVISAQVSGIAIGETKGLTISGNTVLQDTAHRSTSEGRTPVIRVDQASSNVDITGNVTHKDPVASGTNWQPIKSGTPGGWTISNNKIVPVGTTENGAPSAGGGGNDGGSPDPAPGTPGSGNGRADAFRFDGDHVTKAAGTIKALDFSEGDRIVLTNYVRDTFHDKNGGNNLAVNGNGTQVTIDSIADLKELDSASGAVHITEGRNGVLDIEVTQNGHPDHLIHVTGLADAYFA